MFARAIIIAAAVALAAAHVQREHSDDYSPENDYDHDVEYKKPEYGYKESAYDKAYDYAFEHYAHEAKEDKRGLGYGETWEDNFERRNMQHEYKAPKPCKDYSCYTDSEYVPAPVGTCSKGDLQCCNQVQSAKTVDFEQFKASEIYELIPNALRGSNAPVGLACSPLIADTSGGVQCNQQAVCCDGGHFSGLFSVNCNAFNGGSQSAGIF
ncbi:unnamed protein product [Peniophora sp. CBMAI 1063]|nr:unnamed protein product [Peniophora sp. CBMAI 1063]